MIWKGWATLKELEEHWSFDDMMMANETLTAIEDAEQKAAKKNR